MGGRINWEVGTNISTVLYTKKVINWDLLYTTGNSSPHSVRAYTGKYFYEEKIHVHA